MLTYRVISAEPKPGHEFQYYLAQKHSMIAGRLWSKYWHDWKIKLFKPSALSRAQKLDSWAMARVHEHGQDRIETLGPDGRTRNL